ncbi:MAG: nucleotidyltransferase domain-containing protein [Gemmatimonadetes bacterium]|nr:nucleotidyltransferase domain-containing protein [Gemmatimonadota bacterium]
MADPRDRAASFARELQAILGPRLRSALLHGSVARGEAVEGVSDVNVLVLLDRVDPPALRLVSPLARRWATAGNTPPMVMSWAEWQDASDAFAIEVADMCAARVVLAGEDPVANLREDLRAMRLQAERELRGKLVQLRTGLLLAAERPEELGSLLRTALPSFTTYFRAILRLSGRAVPATTPEAIVEAGRAAGFDPDPFLRVWRARAERAPLKPPIDDPLTTGYVAGVTRATSYVDTLTEGRGA